MSSAYSTTQLSRYLEHLALPAHYAEYIHAPQSFPKTPEALRDLFRGQITRFPYENLTLHYTDANPVLIQPDVVYEKMLGADGTTPTGRGGYCFEVNILFHHVLAGLGFTVYMTGVRNRIRVNSVPVGEFRGWVHIVNIVDLPSGATYHLDVGFGGDGPTSPLPLISGNVTKNLGTQEVRLIHGPIPKQTRPEPKFWMYQYRNGPDKEWNSHYCFQEMEWFQEDFEVINRFTTWETRGRGEVLVVRFIRNGEQGEAALHQVEDKEQSPAPATDELHVVGKVMLVGQEVKLNMGGRTKVVESFASEDERLRALRRWFLIQLP